MSPPLCMMARPSKKSYLPKHSLRWQPHRAFVTCIWLFNIFIYWCHQTRGWGQLTLSLHSPVLPKSLCNAKHIIAASSFSFWIYFFAYHLSVLSFCAMRVWSGQPRPRNKAQETPKLLQIRRAWGGRWAPFRGEGARRIRSRNRHKRFLFLLVFLFPFYAFISLGWYAGKQRRTSARTVTSAPASFRKLFYFPSVVPSKRDYQTRSFSFFFP